MSEPSLKMSNPHGLLLTLYPCSKGKADRPQDGVTAWSLEETLF